MDSGDAPRGTGMQFPPRGRSRAGEGEGVRAGAFPGGAAWRRGRDRGTPQNTRVPRCPCVGHRCGSEGAVRVRAGRPLELQV